MKVKVRLEFTDMTTGQDVCPEFDCYIDGFHNSPEAAIMEAKAHAFEEGYCLDLGLDFKIFIDDKEVL